ncbi:Glu-tRNA(Gln) amidotransferase subunit GatE [bacterium]|nr:Glu-tRNA(Gln) amidotransferase subunit GatE [bacterium]
MKDYTNMDDCKNCNCPQMPVDYHEIGLIVGLEVHQQLLTQRKMFCRCPAGLYTKEHDAAILRHMRPTLSELGVFDGAALMEFKTKKQIIYLLHNKNTCTYEMDDTPPFLMNEEALDISIEQCLMLNMDIVDEVHVARKQYLDGSIPTGFQRTAIVGVNGNIPFKNRDLGIIQVSIEEDSCREVSDKGHLIVWRTDRLGMPLVEIVTQPQLYTPEEVEEAILFIGRICRSTNHVRYGIGASRQDVNVSVRGGRRVEIKGIPRARIAARVVHGEAIRQVNLLKLMDELHTRGFNTPEEVRAKITHFDVTDKFINSELAFLTSEGWEMFIKSDERRPDLELGKGKFVVRAVKLEGLAGTLDWKTQPGKNFSDELRGRIRVVSCLDQRPIIIHSEDLSGFDAARPSIKTIMKEDDCKEDDSLIIIWGPEDDVLSACEEIYNRYVDAIDGIPPETRQGFADGHTDFERILPGPNRMYPDTDSPPIRITRDRIEGITAGLQRQPWIREEEYSNARIPINTTYYLIRRGWANIVDAVVEDTGADLKMAGIFFGEKLKSLHRKGVKVDTIPKDKWINLFREFAKKLELAENWDNLVRMVANSPKIPVSQIIDGIMHSIDIENWRDFANKALTEIESIAQKSNEEVLIKLSMAKTMHIYRGIVSGREIEKYFRKTIADKSSINN